MSPNLVNCQKNAPNHPNIFKHIQLAIFCVYIKIHVSWAGKTGYPQRFA